MRTADLPPDHLLLDEGAARRLLLVQALDSVDTQGRLVGQVERDRIEQEALAATGDPALGQRLDLRAWLLARADRILALLAHRQPRLAALAEPPSWQAWAGWLLPLAALLAGGLIDRIDNPRQVNLLSPPLLAFLLWNVAVYVLLLVLACWPHPAGGEREPARPWLQRLALLRTGGLRADVVKAFGLRWWQAAGALEGQRWRRILHTCAAAWAVGVALSIVLGGLVREYRIGWESTLLDLPQVHAFLRALFAPVVALLHVEPFTQAELARLHFGSAADVGRLEARRWVGLYIALLVLVVVVPRGLLAAWAAWRQRRLARRVRIDLTGAGFVALVGRVSPARVRLALWTVGDADAGALRQLLQQAGDTAPPMAGAAWTVLSTARGDALVCREVGVGDVVPAAAGPARWLGWLDRPGRGSPAREPAELLVLVGQQAMELEAALPVARDWDCPVLLLPASGSEAALLQALRGAGLRGEVLALAALPTWREDERLRAALSRLLPPFQAPGLERLWAAWQSRSSQRLDQAMRLLADDLAEAAGDTQPLPVQPLGVRQLVLRAEREAGQDARREAMAALLGRLRERQRVTDARLLALHGIADAQLAARPLPERFRVQQAVHQPQAGLAGAASGAAMGATVDLLTGGLTLGAASALGALVGGGAALAAAAWKNRGAEAGASRVMLDDGQWLALLEQTLLRYLAVAHAGRAGAAPADWPAPVAAALEAQRGEWEAALARLRAFAGDEPRMQLARQLRQQVLDLLAQLHGEARG